MERLIEDYERRIKTAEAMLRNTRAYEKEKLTRLETKLGCYRFFVAEMERELRKTKQPRRDKAVA